MSSSDDVGKPAVMTVMTQLKLFQTRGTAIRNCAVADGYNNNNQVYFER